MSDELLHVLCVNGGSSSLKLALFAVDVSSGAAGGAAKEERIADGSVEGISHAESRIVARVGNDRTERKAEVAGHDTALDILLREFAERHAPEPSGIGHRVVHGGPRHVAPVRIDEAVLADLEQCVPLAPLHMPSAITAIRTVSKRYPTRPQFACFDTAFHAELPALTRRLALSERYLGDGVRRYGFHGLSYEYVMSTLGQNPPSRVVIAHLGNGASLVAVRDGRSIDTTMGLTPTGGIVMGTRSGDLDPGVLVWLMRERGLSADEVEHAVNSEGGLVALGGTSDMRTLLERAKSDPRAALAVETFAYSIRKTIGAYAAALEGLDLLVFTGGIGENAPSVRASACRGLGVFGLELAARENLEAQGDATISTPRSACEVRVVATDEDRMIARHVRTLMRQRG